MRFIKKLPNLGIVLYGEMSSKNSTTVKIDQVLICNEANWRTVSLTGRRCFHWSRTKDGLIDKVTGQAQAQIVDVIIDVSVQMISRQCKLQEAELNLIKFLLPMMFEKNRKKALAIIQHAFELIQAALMPDFLRRLTSKERKQLYVTCLWHYDSLETLHEKETWMLKLWQVAVIHSNPKQTFLNSLLLRMSRLYQQDAFDLEQYQLEPIHLLKILHDYTQQEHDTNKALRLVKCFYEKGYEPGDDFLLSEQMLAYFFHKDINKKEQQECFLKQVMPYILDDERYVKLMLHSIKSNTVSSDIAYLFLQKLACIKLDKESLDDILAIAGLSELGDNVIYTCLALYFKHSPTELLQERLLDNTISKEEKYEILKYLINLHLSQEHEELLFNLANDHQLEPDLRKIFIKSYLLQHEYFKSSDETIEKISNIIINNHDYIAPNLEQNRRTKKDEGLPHSLLWIDKNRFIIKAERLGKGASGSVRAGVFFDKEHNRFHITVLKSAKTKRKKGDKELEQRVHCKKVLDDFDNDYEYHIMRQGLSIPQAKLGKLFYSKQQRGGACHPEQLSNWKDKKSQKILLSQKKTLQRVLMMNGTNAMDLWQLCHMPQSEIFKYLNCYSEKMLQLKLLDIFASALKAIDALHKKGILHHDIKLNNMLVDRFGNVSLIDYDFSQSVFEKPAARGTPGFTSPEAEYQSYVLKSTSKDYKKSDVYSFGMVCYTLWNKCLGPELAQNKYLSYFTGKLTEQDYRERYSVAKAMKLLKKIREKLEQKSSSSDHYQLSHMQALAPENNGLDEARESTPLCELLYAALFDQDLSRVEQYEVLVSTLEQEYETIKNTQRLSFWCRASTSMAHLKELLNMVIDIYSALDGDNNVFVEIANVSSKLAAHHRNPVSSVLPFQTATEQRMVQCR